MQTCRPWPHRCEGFSFCFSTVAVPISPSPWKYVAAFFRFWFIFCIQCSPGKVWGCVRKPQLIVQLVISMLLSLCIRNSIIRSELKWNTPDIVVLFDWLILRPPQMFLWWVLLLRSPQCLGLLCQLCDARVAMLLMCAFCALAFFFLRRQNIFFVACFVYWMFRAKFGLFFQPSWLRESYSNYAVIVCQKQLAISCNSIIDSQRKQIKRIGNKSTLNLLPSRAKTSQHGAQIQWCGGPFSVVNRLQGDGVGHFMCKLWYLCRAMRRGLLWSVTTCHAPLPLTCCLDIRKTRCFGNGVEAKQRNWGIIRRYITTFRVSLWLDWICVGIWQMRIYTSTMESFWNNA